MTALAFIAVVLFTVCALREPSTRDQRPSDIVAAARRAGLGRCLLVAAWGVTVVALTVAAACAHLAYQAAWHTAAILAVIAAGVADLHSARPIGGAG